MHDTRVTQPSVSTQLLRSPLEIAIKASRREYPVGARLAPRGHRLNELVEDDGDQDQWAHEFA